MATKKPFGPNTSHGTVNAYINFGCRCDTCREANNEKQRLYFMTEEGKEARRKATKASVLANRLMREWMKEHHPDVVERLRDEAKAIVYGI